MITENLTPLNIEQILHYLPHRYPFLLIDRIEQIIPKHSIVALKNITMNEPYFTGHFPNKPVMPGVIILEAMAQAAGLLALITEKIINPKEILYYFAGIDHARFKQIVIPGDQLRLEINFEKERQKIWRFEGLAKVDHKIVCTANLMLAGRKVI